MCGSLPGQTNSDKGITNVAQDNLWPCCFHLDLNSFYLNVHKEHLRYVAQPS